VRRDAERIVFVPHDRFKDIDGGLEVLRPEAGQGDEPAPG